MPDTTNTLSNAIAEAVAYYDESPPNEACTCYWIIDPLLKAMGYCHKDIQPQLADGGNQYPDYTILPGSANTWFLEAKAWNVQLKDAHVQQALNYANQNGKRWVVLSSGRRWHLYDNHIIGVASDKLVAKVELRETDESLEFLRAISRSSVEGGELEEYAATSHLRALLAEEFKDPASDLVKAIWMRVKTHPGLANVTRQQIAQILSPAKAEQSGGPATPAGGPEAQAPDTAGLQESFWTMLLAGIKERNIPLFSKITSGKGPWISTGAGISGLIYAFVLAAHSARVELYIDKSSSNTNRAIFDQLSAKRSAIETAFGDTLDWQPLEGKKAKRICWTTSSAGLKDPDAWPELQDELIDAMTRLSAALQPHISALRL